VALEDTGGILPTVNNADLSARSARLPGFPADDARRHGALPALSQRTLPGARSVRAFTAPELGDARQFWVYEGELVFCLIHLT
jgi:hypothetical protein